MSFRLVGRAEDRIDSVLLDSARRGGIEAAARYHRLIVAAMTAIGDAPALAGSRQVPKVPGVWVLHLRSARRLVAREHRVAEPRHLVVYRVAPDGVVEILSLVHDRMLLPRAAARAERETNGLRPSSRGQPSVIANGSGPSVPRVFPAAQVQRAWDGVRVTAPHPNRAASKKVARTRAARWPQEA